MGALCSLKSSNSEVGEQLRTEADYFARNAADAPSACARRMAHHSSILGWQHDGDHQLPVVAGAADGLQRHEVERMRYPKFRRQHLFVGSGVIEAGCETAIASRFKCLAMFWTARGANVILALRCCHLNGRFEGYWEGRRAA